MKLSEFKQHLKEITALNFVQPDGALVPAHFHITEAGLVSKHYVDCGGTVRIDKNVNFQILVGNDVHHRLGPEKLLKIISISEKLLGPEDAEVEMEYQTETIGRYELGIEGERFLLIAKHTACLAKDACGIPGDKQKIQLTMLQATPASSCTPGGGCCS